EHRVAVRECPGSLGCRDLPLPAGDVLDNHRLPELGREMLAGGTGEGIRRTPRAEWNDERDGLRRISRLRSGRRRPSARGDRGKHAKAITNDLHAQSFGEY